MIKQLFTRRIGSDKVVTRIGQTACFGAACLIPLMVFRKFAELELTEVSLLLGVLSTMSLSLLFAVAGVLLDLKTKAPVLCSESRH